MMLQRSAGDRTATLSQDVRNGSGGQSPYNVVAISEPYKGPTRAKPAKAGDAKPTGLTPPQVVTIARLPKTADMIGESGVRLSGLGMPGLCASGPRRRILTGETVTGTDRRRLQL